jgi:tRNA G10  N-methylase Trm11
MKHIFNNFTNQFFFLTNQDININRSSFIKSRIQILYKASSIEEMEANMLQDHLAFNNYKIHYIKQDKVDYQDRLMAMRVLGYTIKGDFAIKDASINFALTKMNNQWIFGYYQKNNNEWVKRKNKPFDYSHAMEVKLAMSVLNIAISNNFDVTVVDPCCGIGTVMIEARSMGIDIEGYDFNRLIVNNCNHNLEYFMFAPDVKRMDMHDITKHYDIAILDLPYNLFSSITLAQQIELIKKAHSISNKLVLVSMENINEKLEKFGIFADEVCEIKKSNAFSRFITVFKEPN